MCDASVVVCYDRRRPRLRDAPLHIEYAYGIWQLLERCRYVSKQPAYNITPKYSHIPIFTYSHIHIFPYSHIHVITYCRTFEQIFLLHYKHDFFPNPSYILSWHDIVAANVVDTALL